MSRIRPSTTDVAALGERLQAVLDRQVDGVLPSCSAALALDGEVVWAGTAGPVTPSTRYAIFSCSKAFVAAVIWQLVDDGALAFDQPVRDVLPGFGTSGATPDLMGRVTVAHLLTHTSGFPTAQLAIDIWTDAAARRATYADWSCATEPGSEFGYHPVAAHWVLADLIEAVDGAPFGERVAERVTRPLGLPPVFAAPDAAADEVRRPIAVGEPPTDDEWRAVGFDPSVAEPDDDQGVDVIEMLSLDMARTVGVPGGGGVAAPSTLALFYQALLRNDAGLWSPDVLRRGTSDIVPGLVEPMVNAPANRTMGLNVSGDDGYQGFRGYGLVATTPRAFGHDGAGGQLACADPDRAISFAFTTDGMDLHAIRQWRRCRRLVDTAFGATAS